VHLSKFESHLSQSEQSASVQVAFAPTLLLMAGKADPKLPDRSICVLRTRTKFEVYLPTYFVGTTPGPSCFAGKSLLSTKYSAEYFPANCGVPLDSQRLLGVFSVLSSGVVVRARLPELRYSGSNENSRSSGR
jgi:hypothetical protein